MLNKNSVIFALAVFIVIGSIWGSIANKKKIILQDQLALKNKELTQSNLFRDELLAKTAGLQADLEKKEAQLLQVREEVIGLRKTNKGLEAKLSIRMAALKKISQEKKELAARLHELGADVTKQGKPEQARETKNDGLAACEARLDVANKKNLKLKAWLEQTRKQNSGDVSPDERISTDKAGANKGDTLRDELVEAQNTVAKLKQRLASTYSSTKRERDKLVLELDSAKAQVIGLEKIIEEKNATIEATEKDLERLRLNMDVLLTTISTQKDNLRQLSEDNKELVKTLALRNDNIADLQEKLLRSPVN